MYFVTTIDLLGSHLAILDVIKLTSGDIFKVYFRITLLTSFGVKNFFD